MSSSTTTHVWRGDFLSGYSRHLEGGGERDLMGYSEE